MASDLPSTQRELLLDVEKRLAEVRLVTG